MKFYFLFFVLLIVNHSKSSILGDLKLNSTELVNEEVEENTKLLDDVKYDVVDILLKRIELLEKATFKSYDFFDKFYQDYKNGPLNSIVISHELTNCPFGYKKIDELEGRTMIVNYMKEFNGYYTNHTIENPIDFNIKKHCDDVIEVEQKGFTPICKHQNMNINFTASMKQLIPYTHIIACKRDNTTISSLEFLHNQIAVYKVEENKKRQNLDGSTFTLDINKNIKHFFETITQEN